MYWARNGYGIAVNGVPISGRPYCADENTDSAAQESRPSELDGTERSAHFVYGALEGSGRHVGGVSRLRIIRGTSFFLARAHLALERLDLDCPVAVSSPALHAVRSFPPYPGSGTEPLRKEAASARCPKAKTCFREKMT